MLQIRGKTFNETEASHLKEYQNGLSDKSSNGFAEHGRFKDENLVGVVNIAEMPVQSHTAYLDILPTLPAEITEVNVKKYK